MPTTESAGAANDALIAAVQELERALDGVDFPLALGSAADGAATARAASGELRDYIIPRLSNLDAPALVVMGGSTGAGKSTLVNSVVGEDVTVPGVLRPTTRAPVLICHPNSLHWFDTPRILPGLARVQGGSAAGTNEIQLVTSSALGEELALIDAPDIDSVVDSNRQLAAELLAAADMWVFVTTAVRYADAVPWQFLHTARDRGTALVVVLNRVPRGALAEVTADLKQHLQDNGLQGVEVIGVEEQPLTDGHIPTVAVQSLRSWLTSLATNHEARARIVRQSLNGALSDLLVRAGTVQVAAQEQARGMQDLMQRAKGPYDAAAENIATDVRDGSVLRGEVLARWQELVGNGELLRSLQSTLGRLRDKITSTITGKKTASDHFQGAVENGVDTLVRARLTEAAQQAYAAWRDHPAGHELLANAPAGLDQPSPGLNDASARLVRDWQAGLVELLRAEGAGKKGAARALSYGVNGLAAVLMVGVFAHTGGLTGAEVAIAGGGSVVGQKLLEALLGDQAVRTLADKARVDLDRRIDELAMGEWQRYEALLGEDNVGDADRLKVAIDAVQAARA